MNEQALPQRHDNGQAAATPPPFRPGTVQEASFTATSPTLADKVAAMGLEAGQAQQLSRLAADLNPDSVTDDLLAALLRGITHDDDVSNAEAAGYLRGRNEKIEAVLHPQPEQADAPQSTPVFPRYCRRSIWD